MSALMVASVLLGFLQFSRPAPRWALFILAIPLSIAVNIVRVTGTAILADHNEAFALGFYHSFSGWMVFLVGFGALYGISRLLQMLIRRVRS
jgi:exosortase/archaeosortase family protein